MAREFTTEIYDNEYIGDSLVTINNNFNALDNSSQTINNNFNTLIVTLTAAAATGSSFRELSATFLSLSALVIP
jgi:hypothetical protein